MVNKIELAIVIPTMNRAELLLGQLFFYDSFGTKIKVYVGDSSTEDQKAMIRNGIKSLKHIDVDFIDSASTMMQVEVIIDLINRTQEEFISVSGDDDYHVIPHALESIKFLKQNPDCVACTGSVAMVSTKINAGLRSILDIVDYGPKRDIVSSDALERMDLLSKYYYLPLFCICRTNDFVEAFKANEKIKNNIFWAETLPAFKLIAMGNLHVREGLAMIRGTHDLRPEYKNSFGDTFMNKTWTTSLHTTLDTLSDYLTTKNISYETSKPRLNQIFAKYYLNHLVKNHLAQEVRPTLIQRTPRPLKNLIKAVYYPFKADKINGGSHKSYSIYYDYFDKLKTSFTMAKNFIQ